VAYLAGCADASLLSDGCARSCESTRSRNTALLPGCCNGTVEDQTLSWSLGGAGFTPYSATRGPQQEAARSKTHARCA